jgi:hypothetical protein
MRLKFVTDTGTGTALNLGLKIKKNFHLSWPVLRIRDVLSRIPDPDPYFLSRIRGVKKHRIPDLGSQIPDPTVLHKNRDEN